MVKGKTGTDKEAIEDTERRQNEWLLLEIHIDYRSVTWTWTLLFSHTNYGVNKHYQSHSIMLESAYYKQVMVWNGMLPTLCFEVSEMHNLIDAPGLWVLLFWGPGSCSNQFWLDKTAWKSAIWRPPIKTIKGVIEETKWFNTADSTATVTRLPLQFVKNDHKHTPVALIKHK